MSYRFDIDGLRCLAVMLVVLFHVQLPGVSGGYLGVDVFFVISGFLVTSVITNSMERGTFRFGNFYARRIRRLFPAVLATVLVSLAAGWFLFPPEAYSDLAQSSIATLLSGSNVYFWATSGYFETAAHYKPLLHTWSLAIEEQFYLVWPLSILLIAGRKPNRRRLLVALAVAVVVSTALAEWAIRSDAMSAAFFLLPFRINEFAIGALVAFLPAIKSRLANEGLALAGLAGVLVPSFLYTPETVFPGLSAMVPCLATAALILAGPQTVLAKVFTLAPLRYVGRISYSVYLAHWPIIAFYLFWQGSATGLEPVEQGALVLASLVFGAALYHGVETPFRVVRGTARIAPKLSNEGVGLWFTASTLATVVAAALIWGNQGYAQRYADNQEIATLLDSMALPGEEANRLYARATRLDGPHVLLLGDSHAGSLKPALVDWGLQNNVKITIANAPGCVPVMGAFSRGTYSEACAERNAMFDDPDAFADVDVVLMVARWGLYTSRSTQRGSRFNKLVQPILLSPSEPRYRDVAVARRRFAKALQDTTAFFAELDIPVVFMTQVPHIGDNPTACISGSRTVEEVEAKCNQATYQHNEQEIRWSANHAAKRRDMTVFDPQPLFCSNGACRITDGTNMLYRDQDHISTTGARLVMTELDPVLLDVLNDR